MVVLNEGLGLVPFQKVMLLFKSNISSHLYNSWIPNEYVEVSPKVAFLILSPFCVIFILYLSFYFKYYMA